MKVVLELQDQPSNVRRVTVRHDIVIGRGADCNLRLSAPQISRRHCFLRVGRDGVSVTDLDSSNGTFVDGERLKSGVRQPLQNGSQLSLGPIRFLIQVRDDAASNESKKSSASKEQKAAAKGKSEPSTIVADVDATLRNAQAMNLAVEQAGATADSREVTSDFVAGQSGASPADAAKKRAAQLPKFDSRAEIVDLGRQLIAAEEEAKNTTFNPPSKPAAAQKSSSVPPAPPAKAASKDVPPPVPPVEDVDAAPADMSFFDDFTTEKTVTPLDDKYDAVEEVFDVAEVVEELPDENIEVVEDEDEAIEVAEVVEEIEEAIEVVDEDDSHPVRGSSTVGNVMSLDDDWEDPDAPARRHRPVASPSSAPLKMSQAARVAGSAPASPPKPAPSAPKSTGSAKPVSAGLKNAASVAAAALPLAVPELVEEADLVEVVEDVEEVVEVAEFDELVEPIEDAVVAVEDEVVEVFDDEVAAVVEADVVDVIDEVQEVAAVEEVLEVADFEPAVEPIATSEVVPVAEIEAAEIVEVSDFFDAAEPEAEVAEVWDEPEVVAADAMMELPPAPELQNEPWGEMAQEDLAIEDAPIDADELVPVVEVDAVSEMTKAPEIANFAEMADVGEVAAGEVSDVPVFGMDAAMPADLDEISSDEPEFNPDWLSADDEPVAQSSLPPADENVTSEDVADWLTAEPEVESVEAVDVIDAAEVSQPSENNDVEVMSEDEIVAVEELLVEDETELTQSTDAAALYAADGAVEDVTASVNDEADAGDDVMSWLSGDTEDLVDPGDVSLSSDPTADEDPATNSGEDIDPNLRDFLKGF